MVGLLFRAQFVYQIVIVAIGMLAANCDVSVGIKNDKRMLLNCLALFRLFLSKAAHFVSTK
jgi:hypothetical protein